MSSLPIAVIGAGPAGAAAAHALRTRGHDVVVFERAEHIGGRTFSFRDGAEVLDTGAGFITNFYPNVWRLAKEFGFDHQIKELHRLTGLHNGAQLGLLNISSTLSFLRFPFLSLADKARMAAWTLGLTFRRRRYDLANPETLAAGDHRSVGDMARADLNEAIYHHLVRPGVEPFWYFDCEEASASLVEALTAHAAGAKFYYVADGIDRICAAMLRDVEVRTGVEVQALRRREDAIELTFNGGGAERSERFSRVVIATTASVASVLSDGLDAETLSPTRRRFLQSQRYAANVHICYRIPLLAEPPGLNAIFPCGAGRHPLAALSFHRPKSPSKVDATTELISVYLSDPESLKVMDWSDEQLHDHGLALARAVYPALPSSAEIFHISRRREAIPIHEVGRYGGAAAFQAEQRQGDHLVYFCGDYLATATIDGAIATGLMVATAMAPSESSTD